MGNDLGKRNDFPEFIWKQDGKVYERFGRHYVERNSSDFGGKQILFNIVFGAIIIAVIFGALYFINGEHRAGKPVSKTEHRQYVKEYIQNRNKPGYYDAGWENHRCEDCKDLWQIIDVIKITIFVILISYL